MDTPDLNVVQPVGGLGAMKKAQRDGQRRRRKEPDGSPERRDDSRNPDDPLQRQEPELLDENFHGDDPHAVDYRA